MAIDEIADQVAPSSRTGLQVCSEGDQVTRKKQIGRDCLYHSSPIQGVVQLRSALCPHICQCALLAEWIQKKQMLPGPIPAGRFPGTGFAFLPDVARKSGQVLAVRVIPCLDIKDGRVVKGVNFVDLKDAGDPVENAIFYAEQGADELTFLDITASSDRRNIVRHLVEEVADHIFIPFAVGGGIRAVADVENILLAGADKVCINTAAFENPGLLTESAARFGSQCIVCAIDARRGGGDFEVFLHGGRTATGRSAIEWAREAEDRGAGEILLTSMDRDGTKDGYDLELTRRIVDSVRIPVIASGGAGAPEHLVEACMKGGAQAALAASIFHFRQFSIAEVKDRMEAAGLPVRRNYSREGLEYLYHFHSENV